jgi:hypothetical protein
MYIFAKFVTDHIFLQNRDKYKKSLRRRFERFCRLRNVDHSISNLERNRDVNYVFKEVKQTFSLYLLY